MFSSKMSIWSIITVTFVAIMVLFSQPANAIHNNTTEDTQYSQFVYNDGPGNDQVHFWWYRRAFTSTFGANLVTVVPKGIAVWGCSGGEDCVIYNFFFENTKPVTESVGIDGQALVTGTFIIRTMVEEPYKEPFEISSTLTIRQLAPYITSLSSNLKAGGVLTVAGYGFTSPFVTNLRSITIWVRNLDDNTFEYYDLIEVLEKGGTWEANLVRLPLRKNLKPGQYLVTITVGGLSSNSLVFSVFSTVFLPSIYTSPE